MASLLLHRPVGSLRRLPVLAHPALEPWGALAVHQSAAAPGSTTLLAEGPRRVQEHSLYPAHTGQPLSPISMDDSFPFAVDLYTAGRKLPKRQAWGNTN